MKNSTRIKKSISLIDNAIQHMDFLLNRERYIPRKNLQFNCKQAIYKLKNAKTLLEGVDTPIDVTYSYTLYGLKQ